MVLDGLRPWLGPRAKERSYVGLRRPPPGASPSRRAISVTRNARVLRTSRWRADGPSKPLRSRVNLRPMAVRSASAPAYGRAG
eukprot:7397909-Pyramimonas_sp.AAC.1